MMKKLFLLAALVAPAIPSRAELVWENRQLDFHPALTDASVKAEFKFTNTGQQPVTIQKVEPGCGCTTAVLDKWTYLPGEKGQITSVFGIGQRTGTQNIPIQVTVQGETQPTILSMVTHIPKFMTMKPQFVYWRTGDAPQPKVVSLEVEPNTDIRLTKISSTDPAIQATLETVRKDREYRVVITPQATDKPAMAAVVIEAVVSPGVQKFFTAYAHIKAKQPPK